MLRLTVKFNHSVDQENSWYELNKMLSLLEKYTCIGTEYEPCKDDYGLLTLNVETYEE